MSSPQIAAGDRIIDPMIALAGCSTRQRIVVAGSKSMELMLELHRRGYLLAAAAGNCGRPTGQYDVAFVDWRRRTLHALEPTMDWLMNFLSPRAMMVVWVDAQKPAANDSLRASVTRRGFVIVRGAVHECSCALLAPTKAGLSGPKGGVARHPMIGTASKGNPDGQAEGATRHYSRVDGTCARETTIRPAGTGFCKSRDPKA